MNDKKLRQLFDYQKFENNAALNFAIQSARQYVSKQSSASSVVELGDELDMLNAAGTTPARVDKDPKY